MTMWLVTTYGFFSVVAHRDEPDKVLIRARSRGDLENLCELGADSPGDANSGEFAADEIIELDDADYRYRLIVERSSWEQVASRLVAEIDYPNFKDAVGVEDPERAHLYMEVWSALRRVEDSA